MNKGLFYGIIMILLASLCSCKKNINLQGDQYQEGWIRVLGIKGKDTSSTKFMNARTETVGLLFVEDSKLSATLKSYTPMPNGKGQYVIEMTNKQPCQVILRWSWEDLTLDSEIPASDVLHANETVTFTFIGDARAGKIKVHADGIDCGNSSTLILNITTTILPITYTTSKAYRQNDQMYVIWSTETPQDVDWFLIMWSPDGNKANEVVKGIIATDANIKNYSFNFAAYKIKKE